MAAVVGVIFSVQFPITMEAVVPPELITCNVNSKHTTQGPILVKHLVVTKRNDVEC